jgi:hypothetical protein
METEQRNRIQTSLDWKIPEETALELHSVNKTAEDAMRALWEAIDDSTTYDDAELLLSGYRVIQRALTNKFPELKEIIIIDSDDEWLEDYVTMDDGVKDDAEDDAEDDDASMQKRKKTVKGNGNTRGEGAKKRKTKLVIESPTGSDSDDGDSTMRGGITKDGSPKARRTKARSTKQVTGKLVVHSHKKTTAEQIRDVRVLFSLLENC